MTQTTKGSSTSYPTSPAVPPLPPPTFHHRLGAWDRNQVYETGLITTERPRVEKNDTDSVEWKIRREQKKYRKDTSYHFLEVSVSGRKVTKINQTLEPFRGVTGPLL